MVTRLTVLILSLGLVHCAHSPTRTFTRTAWKKADLSASCAPMTKRKREEVLRIADPENFFGTRYRKGPRNRRRIERETDCSSFVHEIYRRAGLPYHFRTTRDLKNAPEFTTVPTRKALPGDLVLFRHHVGILGADGKIISATETPRRRVPSSITEYPDQVFGRVKAVLRYRCGNPLYARNSETESRRSSTSQPR